MFCKNCGAKLNDGEMFCPNCGTRVDEGPQAPNNQPGGPPPYGDPYGQPYGNPNGQQYGAPNGRQYGGQRNVTNTAYGNSRFTRNEIIGIVLHFLAAVCFLFSWYDVELVSVNLFKVFKVIREYGYFFEGSDSEAGIVFLRLIVILGIITFFAELAVGVYMLIKGGFDRKLSKTVSIVTLIVTIVLIAFGLLVTEAVKEEIGYGLFSVTFAPYLTAILCGFGLWWDGKKIARG